MFTQVEHRDERVKELWARAEKIAERERHVNKARQWDEAVSRGVLEAPSQEQVTASRPDRERDRAEFGLKFAANKLITVTWDERYSWAPIFTLSGPSRVTPPTAFPDWRPRKSAWDLPADRRLLTKEEEETGLEYKELTGMEPKPGCDYRLDDYFCRMGFDRTDPSGKTKRVNKPSKPKKAPTSLRDMVSRYSSKKAGDGPSRALCEQCQAMSAVKRLEVHPCGNKGCYSQYRYELRKQNFIPTWAYRGNATAEQVRAAVEEHTRQVTLEKRNAVEQDKRDRLAATQYGDILRHARGIAASESDRRAIRDELRLRQALAARGGASSSSDMEGVVHGPQ